MDHICLILTKKELIVMMLNFMEMKVDLLIICQLNMLTVKLNW